MKILQLMLACLLATSCAQTSGILKMGPDTYSVSVHAAPMRGGISGAKRIAVTEANEYCTSLGKEILVKNINTYPSTHFPGGTADITFRCLVTSDKELQRPNYEKTPDIVIENR